MISHLSRLLLPTLFISAIVLFALCFYIIFEWQKPRPYTEPSLWIKTGWGQAQIAGEIARISDLPALPIQIALRLSAQKSLHAGEYDLSRNPSLAALSSSMQQGAVIKRSVTIPEGLTSYQILGTLKASFGVVDDCPAYTALPEGSLLPETYAYTRGDACSAILARMKMALDAQINTLWAGRAPNLPYATPQEALIMASIVERETGVPSERARVAGVFVNRLRLGMPLQSDPTTIYGLSNGTGELGRELTRADWKIPSAYNTYTIPALPPTPIAHAGLDSIKAALHPEAHDFLYFKATGTGGHNFAKTLDEHVKNRIMERHN